MWTRNLARTEPLNSPKMIRYWLAENIQDVANITACATESSSQLARELPLGGLRQVAPPKHPIEHLPLSLGKWATFFSPIGDGARADCVLFRELAVGLEIGQALLCRQLIAEQINSTENLALLIAYGNLGRKFQEVLLHCPNRCVPGTTIDVTASHLKCSTMPRFGFGEK